MSRVIESSGLAVNAVGITLFVAYILFAAEAPPKPVGNILAVVNGEPITLEQVDKMFAPLKAQNVRVFETCQDLLVERMVEVSLLSQKAKGLGYQDSQAYKDLLKDERFGENPSLALIKVMIDKEVGEKVTVSEEEVKAAFEKMKSRLPEGTAFEDVKDQVRQFVRGSKQAEATRAFIEQARKAAKIELNQEWIDKQKAAGRDNPLDKAIKSGKPVLAELGAEWCHWCKQMEPDLKALREELKDVVSVISVDIDEHPRLGMIYSPDGSVPMLLLFGADGKLLWQEGGAQTKAELLEVLKKNGIVKGGAEKKSEPALPR